MSAYAARIAGLIRHLIAAVGVFLVAEGYADDETVAGMSANVETIIGAVLAIGAAGQSFISKAKRVGAGDPE